MDRLEPSEEVRSAFDFRVISRDEKAGRILIQVAMTKMDVLDDILSLMKNLDIYPAAVRHSAVGLPNILLAHKDGYPKDSAVLGLRIEPGWMEIALATPKKQLFSEFILNLEPWSAERLLEEANAFISRIQEPVEVLSKIYLAGTQGKELLEEFKKHIPDSELLVSNVRFKRGALSKSEIDSVTGAVGLAISGLSRLELTQFNLIPPERRIVGSRTSLIPTYALALALLVLSGGWITRDYFQQDELVRQIDAQIQQLQGQVSEAFALRDRVEAQRGELEELRELLKGRQTALLLLRDLTERIPDDTYLQNIQIQGQQVTMQGYSDHASDLPPILLESGYLESVKTNWISQDPRAGKERFNFTATVKEP